jgi:hypothetical protein
MITIWYNSVLGLFHALVISKFVPDLSAREKKHFYRRLGVLIPKLSCANKSSETKILVGTVSIMTVPDKN